MPPQLLQAPACIVVDAAESVIYLVEHFEETPALWIYCEGGTSSQREQQMQRAYPGVMSFGAATMQESPYPSTLYQPIEDYAVVGDLYTVALVGKNGSIDWCCLPEFDAPSVFGALLDARHGGFFRIAPFDTMDMQYRQLYVPETNILVTRFLSREGIAEMTDFMPIRQRRSMAHRHMLIRSVKVVRDSLTFETRCQPAFNYARDPHTITISREGVVFHSKHLSLALTASVPLEQDGHGGAQARFTLKAGQSARFFLQGPREFDLLPSPFSEAVCKGLRRQIIRKKASAARCMW
jgi:Trehalase-like, N-terminal